MSEGEGDMGKALPERFPPAEESFALYEDIEYRRYWEDPALARLDALERHIVSALLPASGHRIVDVGCGYGRLTSCYRERFDELVLFDGSLSLLREARRALGDSQTYVAGDIARLPFRASSFDCVLAVRVLQHARNLEATIGEMSRITTMGGTFVFSYHNKSNPRRLLRYLANRHAGNPFDLESTEVRPTLISHHPDRIGSIMSDVGFSAPEYHGTVVLNPLARVTELLFRDAPAGARWARFMGRHRIAPWLVGVSVAQRGEELAASDPIDELFACPICRGGLERTAGGYHCPACSRDFPLDDGIYDFRC